MKTFILIIFLGLSFFSYSQTDSIKGNLKSVREQTIFLDNDLQNRSIFETMGEFGLGDRQFTMDVFKSEWYGTPYCQFNSYYSIYNDKNNLSSDTWYFLNGDTLISLEYSYDKNNNITEKKEIDNGETVSIKNIRYNENNQPIASATLCFQYRSGFNYVYYIYNTENLLIKENDYDENGYSGGHEYEYDRKGRLIRKFDKTSWVHVIENEKESYYARKDTSLRKLTLEYMYDDRGNIYKIQRYSYRWDTSYIMNTVTYTYDDKNRSTSRCSGNDSSKYHHLTEYTYYDNGLLKSEAEGSSADFARSIRREYFYDSSRNVKKLVYRQNGKEQTVQFKYKFDSRNNWTEQTKIVDGKPLFVRRREIIYKED